MKKGYPLFAVAVLVSLFAANAWSASTEKTPIADFTLKDLQGHEHSLSDYSDARAIVLMFIATRCPVSNAYNGRMKSLHDDYKDKGVVFLGINSNNTEPADEVKKHAGENGFEFTVLKDPDNAIADRLGANVTPEIYLLDGGRTLLYHGRIDDAQNEEKVKSHDLRTALDEVLAGGVVTRSETKAFGCTIKKVSR